MFSIEELVKSINGRLNAGQPDAALDLLQSVAAQNPTEPHIPFFQAQILAIAGHVDQAIEIYRDVIERFPRFPNASISLGHIYDARGQSDLAFQTWRRVYRNNAMLHSQALQTLLKSPHIDNLTLLEAQVDWGNRYGQRSLNANTHRFAPYHGDRVINIGYACSYWDSASIRFMILPSTRAHDRSRFRVYGYGPNPVPPRISETLDNYRVCGQMSDDAFINQVRADAIDVLVELNGFTAGHRFAAMAGRCAPVQVNHLNHSATCGVPNVDYVLVDEVCVTPGEECFYTEHVYRMPGCFLCFNYDECPPKPPGPCPFERNGHITFGCFASGMKVTDLSIRYWADVLRETPGSKIYLRNPQLNPADNSRFMKDRFERLGISQDRVVIKLDTDRAAVIASYDDVDIALDTIPYGGGNTTTEALWQGVPVVTYKGPRFSSRFCASVLIASGCQEFVASTPESFVELAAALSRDKNRLRYYRTHLRQMCVDHGLSDVSLYTRRLENAYVEMLVRANEGILQPDPNRAIRNAIRDDARQLLASNGK